MTDRELFEKALEALEETSGGYSQNLIAALRERLREPEIVINKSTARRIATALGWEPRREWVGLTAAEFRKAVDGLEDLEDCWVALEHALKEKNT